MMEHRTIEKRGSAPSASIESFICTDFPNIPAELKATRMSGYILKEGSYIKSWKRRFFVLDSKLNPLNLLTQIESIYLFV